MASFKDNQGRTWTLTLNGKSMARAKAAGFNYWTPAECAERLYVDDGYFKECVWHLLDSDPSRPNVTAEEFADSLTGDCIDLARVALEEETYRFFSSATFSRYQAETMVAKSMTAMAIPLAEELDRQTKDPEVLRAVAAGMLDHGERPTPTSLSSISTASPGLSDVTPTVEPSANS